MRRVPLLALSALLLAMPMAVAAQRELPTIAGEGIRLVLDPAHGGIRRLETASGQEVAVRTRGSACSGRDSPGFLRCA